MERDPADDRPEPERLEEKETLVIGCGNVLIGDDGFGPAFIKHLAERGGVPESVGLLDAGTGVRKVLFDLALSERRPRRIIVVDAIDVGRRPGEVFEIDLEGIPAVKSDDFSMHQLPTSNLLKELREECGVEVRVAAVQVESIPPEVKAGLSKPVAAAMGKAAELVLEMIACPLTL
ncbi:MAG: hydrogenase maturation protease [Elusimicrobia bacterium]|nr:hydrogenase maturation protease [Elusimicrobiota bacterium]